MELLIKGTPQEIKIVFEAICGGQEHKVNASELAAKIEGKLASLNSFTKTEKLETLTKMVREEPDLTARNLLCELIICYQNLEEHQ